MNRQIRVVCGYTKTYLFDTLMDVEDALDSNGMLNDKYIKDVLYSRIDTGVVVPQTERSSMEWLYWRPVNE